VVEEMARRTTTAKFVNKFTKFSVQTEHLYQVCHRKPL